MDFSGSCLGAARYVEAFARRFEAAITLHVVGMGEHNLAGDLLPWRQKQLDAFLADELRYFTGQRLCVGGDDAAAEAVNAACRLGADLVIDPVARAHLNGLPLAEPERRSLAAMA